MSESEWVKMYTRSIKTTTHTWNKSQEGGRRGGGEGGRERGKGLCCPRVSLTENFVCMPKTPIDQSLAKEMGAELSVLPLSSQAFDLTWRTLYRPVVECTVCVWFSTQIKVHHFASFGCSWYIYIYIYNTTLSVCIIKTGAVTYSEGFVWNPAVFHFHSAALLQICMP